MLFSWKDETIRWYEAANSYTGFYKNLAITLEPMISDATTFADMGCGLGLVDLELSPRVGSICCVDISEEALDRLRENARERGIFNLEILKQDCFQVDRDFDVIYLCFFSSKNIKPFLSRCRKLISIVGGGSNAPLFPQRFRTKKRNTVSDESEYLNGLKIPYKLTHCEFEFGQPLISMRDAHAYVRTYAPAISKDELDEFLGMRLIKTGDGDYPFYLPRKKAIGIFEIEGALGT